MSQAVKETELSERTWQASQSWYYEAIWEMTAGDTTTKLRIDIRRNAYDEQSHAYVWAWHPQDLKWNHLRSIPVEALACLPITYVTERDRFEKEEMIEMFRSDRTTLLQDAAEVLN